MKPVDSEFRRNVLKVLLEILQQTHDGYDDGPNTRSHEQVLREVERELAEYGFVNGDYE